MVPWLPSQRPAEMLVMEGGDLIRRTTLSTLLDPEEMMTLSLLSLDIPALLPAVCTQTGGRANLLIIGS